MPESQQQPALKDVSAPMVADSSHTEAVASRTAGTEDLPATPAQEAGSAPTATGRAEVELATGDAINLVGSSELAVLRVRTGQFREVSTVVRTTGGDRVADVQDGEPVTRHGLIFVTSNQEVVLYR